MRYFKILNNDGNLAAFGENDTIGEEITEEEYSTLRELYPKAGNRDLSIMAQKAQAWDIMMGVTE